MENKNLRWIYLIVLSLVWGSSFILMKKALIGLTPIQVGVFRILITTVFLLLIGFKSLFKIKRRHWYYLLLNGFLGTFFPVFLFAFAVENIDSSVASILNSLTPLNTLIFGALVFGIGFSKRQALGVLIGLIGTLMLILEGASLNPNQNYFYSLFVLLASIGYAFNVNIIKKYLHDLNALSIAVGNFVLLIIPTFMVMWYTDFFGTFEINSKTTTALIYMAILAIFGTAVSKIMYNRLVQISTPIFSSSVTYLIPVIAIFWGLLDGERISFLQFLAGCIVIIGVYLANKAK
ncbi:DMT family transporter [Lutibacter sp.]|uniref:DMT family transporter n=1 Tax=Lutibacter sp. TaxID=1925666 RepID=UPI003566F4A4